MELCYCYKVNETVEEALAIADKLGYPVVVRPAYTMGGAGGGLVYNVEEFDPDPFMDALNKWGLPWIEDRNPVLVD